MGLHWYIYAFFVFVLAGLFVLLLRYVLRGMNAGNKQYERENKLFLLYQNVEDMMESLESYAEEFRGEVAKEKADMAAMLIQARQLPALQDEGVSRTTAQRRAREAELDQLLSVRTVIDEPRTPSEREPRASAEGQKTVPASVAKTTHNSRERNRAKPTQLPPVDRMPAMERIAHAQQKEINRQETQQLPSQEHVEQLHSLFDIDTTHATATVPAAMLPPEYSSFRNRRGEADESAQIPPPQLPEQPANEMESFVDLPRNRQVFALHQQGKTDLDISRELGISTGEIALILGLMGGQSGVTE